jgi:hypothetical protein
LKAAPEARANAPRPVSTFASNARIGFFMASSVNAALCALLATAFCTVLGYALCRHVLSRALALGAAPVLGWAVFSAATLPIFTAIGFSAVTVTGVAALCLALAGGSLLLQPGPAETAPEIAIKPYCFVAAALVALIPAVAILPKYSADGVHLATPIFDHSKIAIVDAMMRQGLPPVDPVFAAGAAGGRLVYYYLWHFSAAELALPLRASGWEADVGLTWFTAFASLAVMMAAAVWLSKRASAAIWVVAFATAASLREAARLLIGSYNLEPFLQHPNGFAGWLYQSSWAPQHLMSASCTVTAMLLIVHYAERQNLTRLVALVLVVVAGFESSVFVGGVTFAIAALASAPLLLADVEAKQRRAVVTGLVTAAVLAMCLAAPFLRDELGAVSVREGARPIIFHHLEVLGDMFPAGLRRVLDGPAYWLILLPIEFPATFVAGTISFVVMLRNGKAGLEHTAAKLLFVLAAAGLSVSWLLASTLGDNNDLGLRAVLPAVMVLIVGAAVAMTAAPRRALIVAAALVGFALSLPDTIAMIASNVKGSPAAESKIFAQSPELWSAVRRYAGANARVANNPLFLQDLTPWPVNISWALIADRSSCFAGRELALAFAPLPADRREAINAQFIRVFAGQGTPQDTSEFAREYSCDVVVVVPQDGAWNNDPFAASPDYSLAETRENRWRIYVRRPSRIGD